MSSIFEITPTVTIEIPGQPVPKQRPIVNRLGVAHTPQKTKVYEGRLAWEARFAMGVLEPLQGDLRVQLAIRSVDNRRSDIDNIIKSLLDGCNQIVWDDDSQIIDLHATLERNSRNPGATIIVYRAQS